MNIEWGHFISIYWILIKFCIAYKGFIQVECKHTMAKGSTANIFNENLTSADSSFRTLDLEIFRSISLTRNSHATITDDVRRGFYIFKNCRYIQLNAYFWWSRGTDLIVLFRLVCYRNDKIKKKASNALLHNTMLLYKWCTLLC